MDYWNYFALAALTLFVMSCQQEETHTTQTTPEFTCPEALSSDWEIIPSLTTNSLNNVSFYDDNHGIIAGSFKTILTTDDGGINWQSSSEVPSLGIQHSFILNKDEIFICGARLYKSNDGGKSFSEIEISTTGPSTFNMHFFNSEKGLIYRGNDILGTENGGLSWSEKMEEGTSADEFFFVSDDVGFIAGGLTSGGPLGGVVFSEGKIHKTIDMGDSWELIHLDDWEIRSIYFINEDIGFYTNNNRELYSTANGGLEWELVNGELPTSVNDMVYMDSCNGFIAGWKVIYKTKDGGINWEIDFEDDREILSMDKKPDNTLIAVGREGLILKKE